MAYSGVGKGVKGSIPGFSNFVHSSSSGLWTCLFLVHPDWMDKTVFEAPARPLMHLPALPDEGSGHTTLKSNARCRWRHGIFAMASNGSSWLPRANLAWNGRQNS